MLYLGELATVILLMAAAALGTCIGEISPGSLEAAEYAYWYLLNSGKIFDVSKLLLIPIPVDGVVGADVDVVFPSFSPLLVPLPVALVRADILGI